LPQLGREPHPLELIERVAHLVIARRDAVPAEEEPRVRRGIARLDLAPQLREREAMDVLEDAEVDVLDLLHALRELAGSDELLLLEVRQGVGDADAEARLELRLRHRPVRREVAAHERLPVAALLFIR